MKNVQNKFASSMQKAAEFERRGAYDQAIIYYKIAENIIPGHAAPFTRIAIIMARNIWGPPVSPRPASSFDSPRITMSSLGRMGRFGNQLLQYGILRLYADACGCDIEVPDWIGRDLFGLNDPLISRQLPYVEESSVDVMNAISGGFPPRANIDLAGFFAFSTQKYANQKKRFQSLFNLRGGALSAIELAWNRIGGNLNTVVALHLRRGDFGYGKFWIAPLSWYKEWLEAVWPTLHNPVLYIATDDRSVLGEFRHYQPRTANSIATVPNELEFVVDFFMLTRANIVAISNSTFSFVASMLNRKAASFLRPDDSSAGLIDYDPWNAMPLLEPKWIRERGSVSPQEIKNILSFIYPNGTVVDVGANRGEWSRAVQNNLRGRVRIFAFEPNPLAFKTLNAWAETTRPNSATVAQLAIGEKVGTRPFYLYEWQDEFSGFKPRKGPMFAAKPAPRQIEVECTTLDKYCLAHRVRHIQFLKIDTEGAEFEVIRGCAKLLSHARIDVIQFEYGGTYRDSGVRLEEVYKYLSEYQYRVFKMSDKLVHLEKWSDEYEDYLYSNYLAINARLTPFIGVGERKLPDLSLLVTRYGVKPRGAIHVGAHLGEEYESYKNIGVSRIIMVEANPNIYRDLEKKLGNVENVILVNRAISDANERRPFHIMNATQSSSLLAPKRHSEIYPKIIERAEVNVMCSRLDDLLEELGETSFAYNILNIDVQGAEMMVLHGASEVLKAIEVIYLEVNFDELYSGCCQIEEVDEFLSSRGFSRVALVCPYHPSWGDAVYVRNQKS